MHQLFRFLGVLAVVFCSIGQASAFSFTEYPLSLTGGPEKLVISYSSSETFYLRDLSLNLGYPAGPTNVLAGISGSLFQFTSHMGANVAAGSGTFSEIISAPAGNYTFSFATSADGLTATVSPVPLPASSLLFMMALAGFGLVGFLSTRQTKLVSA
jgi:hypothetical protein